uniref:Uncharacterized protein n=1 Tax=Hanusia phi TaxID=3032 RepID=A0A7S0HB63_9CRYP|eukprot:753937-Hanusia_phi.AAC.2
MIYSLGRLHLQRLHDFSSNGCVITSSDWNNCLAEDQPMISFLYRNKRIQAWLHGFEFMQVSLGTEMRSDGCHPIWSKLDAIIKALTKGCAKVLWIDAGAQLHGQTLNFFSHFGNQNALFLVTGPKNEIKTEMLAFHNDETVLNSLRNLELNVRRFPSCNDSMSEQQAFQGLYVNAKKFNLSYAVHRFDSLESLCWNWKTNFCLGQASFLDRLSSQDWFRTPRHSLPVCSEPESYRYAKDLAVVTGASSNHYSPLIAFLRDWPHRLRYLKFTVQLVVVDLGLEPSEKSFILRQFGDLMRFTTFDFSQYPSFFNISIARGEYAWKPAIVYNTFLEYYSSVLWLDSGNAISEDAIFNLYNRIVSDFFVSSQTGGTVSEWVYEKTSAYLVPNKELRDSLQDKAMCNGALVGFYSGAKRSVLFLQHWYNCALQRECIAPEGSSLANHRQDQSTLTVMAHIKGFGSECTKGGSGVAVQKRGRR